MIPGFDLWDFAAAAKSWARAPQSLQRWQQHNLHGPYSIARAKRFILYFRIRLRGSRVSRDFQIRRLCYRSEL